MIEELRDLTACGWLLSVLRAPRGTGIIFDRSYLSPQQKATISIASSCKILRDNGLDHSIYDLLYIVHGSSVDEVVRQIGSWNFAAKTRATMQLTALYRRFKSHFEVLENSSVIISPI